MIFPDKRCNQCNVKLWGSLDLEEYERGICNKCSEVKKDDKSI